MKGGTLLTDLTEMKEIIEKIYICKILNNLYEIDKLLGRLKLETLIQEEIKF